jgi:Tol biopolymer transport system component
MIKKNLILTILLLLVLSLQAQFYNGAQLTFGKNRVQYQNFNWQLYRSNLYDVYYYPTSKPLGEYTYGKAAGMISDIERILNYSLYKKIHFIVYNTQADFRESNFGYDNEDFYNQGGVTNIYGNKVYLYFDGDHNRFDKMIKSGITTIFARNIVEGESVMANITSEHLSSLPNWFYSGLASYIAENWSPDIDVYIKNGILSKRYELLEDLNPVEATYAGHSFWKFIVDRYGEATISNILYSVRSTRNVEKSLYYVTGVPYKELTEDWFRYYYVLYKKEIKRGEPETAGLLKKPNLNREYSQITLSPDGESFAYVTNEAGQIKVWVQTALDKKPKVIFKKLKRTEDNPDLSFPLVAWHPSGDLIGFTIEDKGRCYYYPYIVSDKKLEKRFLVDVEKITDWSYSDDGKFMLFSGFRNGQSDLFLYSFQSRSYQNLTNDFYDDYGPRFMNNQKDIIFSSNRPVDSLDSENKFFNLQNQPNYDLFVFHYAAKEKQLLQVTYTPFANEKEVRISGKNQIIYLSDDNGIYNRYVAKFDSTITKIDTIIHYAYFAKTAPLTDMGYSIIEQDYVPGKNSLGELIMNNKVKRLYKGIPNLQKTISKLIKTDQQLYTEKNSARIDSMKKKILVPEKPKVRKGFQQVRMSDFTKKTDASQDNTLTADSTGRATDVRPVSFPFEVQVPRSYTVQFNINKLITQADFSFLNTSYQQFTGDATPIYLNSGMNSLFMVGITDLFENYRITAGFRLPLFYAGSEIMLSYEDLSKRLDQQFVIYRQSIEQSIGYRYIKQISNSVFYNFKFPFDKFNSVRVSLKGRQERFIESALSDETLIKPSEVTYWTGAKIEYVFDSSKELYTNLWKGTKCKLFVEFDYQIADSSKNLLVAGFDIRKSIKVFRNITWATRFAGSTNFGSARLVYYMGGVDNWITPSFNSDIYVDKTKNYHYQTLATSMRGFQQNTRNGTSFVLLSSELRIPFVQLLAKRNLTSTFFNSMQLISFVDIGTAWTGLTPYSEDNGLYIRYITSGNITAIVKRQVDPWVAGFGLGLRAILFSYFIRFDYAWGLEDFRVVDTKGVYMLSIGTDF